MGSKPIKNFSFNKRHNFFILGVSGLALFLSACISDGPNQTGGEYLQNQGIVRQNPLYHVVIPNFPVDTFWTRTPQNTHFNSQDLMLGASGKFFSQLRLGFVVQDTGYASNLKDSTDFITLAFKTYRPTVGLTSLKASVGDTVLGDTIKTLDSLGFILDTWAFSDKDTGETFLTDAKRNELIQKKNRSFLSRFDPDGALDKTSFKDTIYLKIKSAYKNDTLQIRALPKLTSLIKDSNKKTKWLIQFQLTPIALATDSAQAMLRIQGQTPTLSGAQLLFGKPDTTTGTKNKQIVETQVLYSSPFETIYSQYYQLHYSGAKIDIVPALQNELHLNLSRTKVLDSINAILKKQLGLNPPSGNKNSVFDLTYFLPYAQLTVPLANQKKLEGGFPIALRMQSELDSLIPGNFQKTRDDAVVLVPLNGSELIFTSRDPTGTTNEIDSVFLLYSKKTDLDSLLRMVILKSSRDSLKNDTIFLASGTSKNIIQVNQGKIGTSLRITLDAQPDFLTASYSLNNSRQTENNEIRNTTTGALLTKLSEMLFKYVGPKTDSINLRATHGIQTLLNRVENDKNIFSDLIITADSPIDLSVINEKTTEPAVVPYKVMSSVAPKLSSGKLFVRLELFLYPLKKSSSFEEGASK